MESNLWIATGHARTARARERSQQAWVEITNILNNSSGNGCIKTWQQWQKYWKDKKGAVKRKCSSIAIARRRTGGGMDETAAAELTHLEQRIVSLMGGESFATGQEDLELPVIHVAESIDNNQTISSGQSQSILQQQININNESLPQIESYLAPENLSTVAVAGEEFTREILTNASQAEEVSLTPRLPAIEEQVPPTSPVSHSRFISNSTHMSPGESERRRGAQSSPRRRARRGCGTPTARRRLLQRSPPSQRRSEMASLTERFIAIEERRVETEARIARSQEMYAQAQQGTSESVAQLAQAWAAHAQALNSLAEAITNRDKS